MTNTTELEQRVMRQQHFPPCFPKFSETAQQNAAVTCSQNFNMLIILSCKNNSLWLGSYLSESWSCHRTWRLPGSLLRRLSRSQHEQDYTQIKQNTLQIP